MKKTKRDIGKAILKSLLYAGTITIAVSSPNFSRKIIPQLIREIKYRRRRKNQEKSFYTSFYYLRKNGYIRMDNRNGQLFIGLTKEGKEKANKCRIDDLEIKKPKKWDKKWRILIFDINDNHKIKREALRGKIKQLGMFQLQKSVWVHPYNFQKEIDYLRNFFHLNKKELQIIVAQKIEDDSEARAFFHLN